MTTTEFLQRYANVLTNFAFDLVAISAMAYVLYFRRHWRTDLLLSYVALNMGIFVTMTVLTQVKVDIATGFGLFAILSIIRLRSSAVTQQEVAYYFLALVLGLVNGLGVQDRWLVLGLNVVVLLTMAFFDSSRVRNRAYRVDIKIDGVYTKPAALIAEVERQLGAHVIYVEITEIDLQHNHMSLDVRVRPGEGVVNPPHEKDRHKQADADPVVQATPPSPHPHPHPQPSVQVGPTDVRYDGAGGATHHGG